MIGSGSGEARKSGPAGGRRRRSTATNASVSSRTRRTRPWPGSRAAREPCARGHDPASVGRFSTGTSARAAPPLPAARPAWFAVAGSVRLTSDGVLIEASPTRPSACAARTCAKRIRIGSACRATKTQVARAAATLCSVKAWVAGSTPSVPATEPAGAGSTAGAGATSSDAEGAVTTGASVAGDSADSADGAGAAASSVATGLAVGSSSAGRFAVGSSS